MTQKHAPRFSPVWGGSEKSVFVTPTSSPFTSYQKYPVNVSYRKINFNFCRGNDTSWFMCWLHLWSRFPPGSLHYHFFHSYFELAVWNIIGTSKVFRFDETAIPFWKVLYGVDTVSCYSLPVGSPVVSVAFVNDWSRNSACDDSLLSQCAVRYQ